MKAVFYLNGCWTMVMTGLEFELSRTGDRWGEVVGQLCSFEAPHGNQTQ